MAYIGQAPINGFHAKQQLTGDGSTVTYTLDQTVATETRRAEVLNADGSFKEYHASNTTTLSRTVDMVMHYTDNPNDDVDAGLVSLVAD